MRSGFLETCRAGELWLFGHHFPPGDDAGAATNAFMLATGLILNLLAFVFGLALGVAADRVPALSVLRVSGVALALALVCGAGTVGLSGTAFVLTLVVFGALGLAGIWTAGRKVVIQLAPRERRGEYFGLYGMTTKLSVVGCITFTLVHDHLGIRAALLVQLAPVLIGIALLHRVSVPASQEAS